MISLFEKKQDCCGCGSCVNVCPKNAITMTEDEDGFIFPSVNNSLCISCGLCKKVCHFTDGEQLNTSSEVFVAVNKDKSKVLSSSSGGMFIAAAEYIIENGGIVYGAAYRNDNGYISVEHIGVEQKSELYRLQGSKYVQSNIGKIYQNVKKELDTGRLVLFSGTPCQISGLRGYLRKIHENLFTIDIICHGVPNQKLLNDYIQNTICKHGKKINRIDFRSKNKGWDDYQFKYYYDGNGSSEKAILFPCFTSSYYTMFLEGSIFRESCYQCQYASMERTGDITLGDFWGIRHQHPELFRDIRWKERMYEGISCLLINTVHGRSLVEKIISNLELIQSDFQKASAENGQLCHPVSIPDERKKIFDIYRRNGYSQLEKMFRKKIGKKYYYLRLKNKFPFKLKLFIKRVTRTL